MNRIYLYIAIVVLIAFSAFFSASEIAFASVNTVRLKNKGTRNALRAIKIAEDYNNTLSAILIGNNLVNMAASSIATVIVLSLLGENFAWVATLIMTVVVLIFGETVPKVLAKEFAESYSCKASFALKAFTVIFKPVTVPVMFIVNLISKIWSNNVSDSTSVSEEDLENIIDIVEDEGVLDEEQCDLLQNALDWGDVLAYEIITPRVDMYAIDIHDPYEKNVEKILDSTFSRIPVYEDTPDNIIGILHMNHFYKLLVERQKVNIREMLLDVVCVHKTMPLPDVLEKMKEAKTHMVVVLDEYGGTMGIVTMEDVLEQLVGEIFDENDEFEREFTEIAENLYEADGDMRIYDFFDEFDIDFESDEEADDGNITIGGFAVSMLEGEVKEGSTFVYENLEITVKETDGFRVSKLLVKEIELKREEQE